MLTPVLERIALDTDRLKESFAHVARYGDEVALFFYSDLFLRAPQVRDLFPVSMAAQRDRLLGALIKIVSDVDSLDSLVPFLRGLGRDHRKFGALAEHYDAVGTSLLVTLAHFSGSHWTNELAADWKAAYALIAQTMIEAAKEDEDLHPPWWDATVIGHERRSFDIAVFRVAPLQRLPYAPGQSVAIESEDCPRTWRFYSMANAPRADGTLDFHVRMVDGGALSSALTRRARPGSRLRLGPAVGALTLDPSGRDILMVAGSTGLAPLKAILEEISAMGNPPRVDLFFGARTTEGLYDLPDLEKMAAESSWLNVTHAVSDDPWDPGYGGERGTIADVVARHGLWREHDAYICGSTAMVRATADRLASAGVPGDQIHVEDFGWSR
jgi:NAD(P)H-flavin reductase/hemoglobin-like flavoprotein